MSEKKGLSPIEYDPIPCVASVLVFFENEQTETWGASVSAAGKIKALVDTQGRTHTSLQALHDQHVTAFTLEFEHTVGVLQTLERSVS